MGGMVHDAKFKKMTHARPMLSLSNSYNLGDIEDFIKRGEKIISKEINSIEKTDYVLEVKLDGLSISVIYENGKLVKGVTRGDGKIGEDVTENIMEIASIPKFLKENINIEVRGEVVLPISKFKKLNVERMNKGKEVRKGW